MCTELETLDHQSASDGKLGYFYSVEKIPSTRSWLERGLRESYMYLPNAKV